MSLSVSDLFKAETAASFFSRCLATAESVGLITTTWRIGDPTLTMYTFLARALATKESSLSDLAKSAFLSSASGDWLTILASEVYGVERVESAPATSTLALTNTGGGYYDRAAGSAVFKSTLSGKTYKSVSALSLHGVGATATVDVIADEAGTASSAGPNEIDSIVTTMLGVEITSSTVAVGLDQQEDEPLREQCRASRGALSPNGPADAYEYVARNSELTGVSDITRATADADNTNFTVIVYVASASGPAAGASVSAAQAAIQRWATPLCVTSVAINAAAQTINVAFTAHGDAALPVGSSAAVASALGELFAALPIAKGAGYDIDPTTITTAIRNAVPQIKQLPSYSPSTPVHVAAGFVPVLGTVTMTEV